MNVFRRAKLRAMLRHCDYILAGTVIKQQYYDEHKDTQINRMIDQFMANPGFEEAIKLIKHNELFVYYFTESCHGGLYVRKQQTQDNADDEMQLGQSSTEQPQEGHDDTGWNGSEQLGQRSDIAAGQGEGEGENDNILWQGNEQLRPSHDVAVGKTEDVQVGQSVDVAVGQTEDVQVGRSGDVEMGQELKRLGRTAADDLDKELLQRPSGFYADEKNDEQLLEQTNVYQFGDLSDAEQVNDEDRNNEGQPVVNEVNDAEQLVKNEIYDVEQLVDNEVNDVEQWAKSEVYDVKLQTISDELNDVEEDQRAIRHSAGLISELSEQLAIDFSDLTPEEEKRAEQTEPRSDHVTEHESEQTIHHVIDQETGPTIHTEVRQENEQTIHHATGQENEQTIHHATGQENEQTMHHATGQENEQTMHHATGLENEQTIHHEIGLQVSQDELKVLLGNTDSLNADSSFAEKSEDISRLDAESSFAERVEDASRVEDEIETFRTQQTVLPNDELVKPRRSFPNVISTLSIDLNTMVQQVDEYRTQLKFGASNPDQLRRWIASLEKGITEFAQAIDLLEGDE